jgi:hypothetical protein
MDSDNMQKVEINKFFFFSGSKLLNSVYKLDNYFLSPWLMNNEIASD